jgi:hypothetical protein
MRAAPSSGVNRPRTTSEPSSSQRQDSDRRAAVSAGGVWRRRTARTTVSTWLAVPCRTRLSSTCSAVAGSATAVQGSTEVSAAMAAASWVRVAVSQPAMRVMARTLE